MTTETLNLKLNSWTATPFGLSLNQVVFLLVKKSYSHKTYRVQFIEFGYDFDILKQNYGSGGIL